MLVLSVGLLGLASLQATSLKNNQSAYNRSQATLLAYDMADRIRANPVDAKNLATSVYIDNTASTAAVVQTGCKVSPGCTPATMAQNDFAEWKTNISALPLGTGKVEIDAATPNPLAFIITISWDDDHQGAANRSFVMEFQL